MWKQRQILVTVSDSNLDAKVKFVAHTKINSVNRFCINKSIWLSDFVKNWFFNRNLLFSTIKYQLP